MRISIFGGSEVLADEKLSAREIGHRLATLGHQVVTGGFTGGIMEAASQGASEGGKPAIGVTCGSIPSNQYCVAEPEPTFGQRLERLVTGSDHWIIIGAEGSCGTGIELLTVLQFKLKKKLSGKMVVLNPPFHYLAALLFMAGENVHEYLTIVTSVEEAVAAIVNN